MKKIISIALFAMIFTACSTGKVRKPEVPEADSLDSLPGVKTKFQIDTQNSKSDVLSGESLDRSLMGDLDEAAKACLEGNFSKGLGLYRERLTKKVSASDWSGLGNCYFRAGKSRVALLNYLKALSLNSKHGPTLNNIGVVWLSLGEKAKALTHFKKALRLSKFSRVPRWNLARIYLKHRHYWSAYKHFLALYKLNSSDSSVIEGLAYSSHGKGSLKDAGRYYRKLAPSAASSAELQINYALWLETRGRYSLAKKFAELAGQDTATSISSDAVRLKSRQLAQRLRGK